MKTTLSVSIEEELDQAVRAEAERQRRPLSWIVEDALRKGLPEHPAEDSSPTAPAQPPRTRRVQP